MTLRFSGYWLIILIISVLGAAGLLVLGIYSQAPQMSGKYAVIIYDNAFDEAEILSRLEEKKINDLISESNQLIFLNDFDSIEMIPLKEYDKRVLPIDPRNDGYADKLKSMFAHGEKRYIYLPVFRGIENRIASAMTGIPYFLEYSGKVYYNTPPSALLLIIFSIVTGIFLIIPKLRKIASPAARQLLPCLPFFAVICVTAGSGFALVSLLSGIAYLTAMVRKNISNKQRFSKTFKIYIFLLASLIIFYWLISLISGLSVLFTLLTFIIFSVIILLSISRKFYKKYYNLNNHEHKQFVPIMILKQNPFNYNFSIVMLPLALAALVFSFSAVFYPESKTLDWNKTFLDITVTKTDFINHYLFQSTFSERPLYASREQSYNYGSLTNFVFDSEGLFIKEETKEFQTPDIIPLFPLEDLLNHIKMQDGFQADNGGNNELIKNILAAFLPWLIIIPVFFRRLAQRPTNS